MAMGTIQNGRREYIRENHSVNVGIGAIDTVIVSVTIPPKTRAKVTSFGNYIGTVAAWGVCYWTIYINGVPCSMFGTRNIMDQIGYAAQRQPTTEWEISGGSLVQVCGTNPTAAILAMGVSLEIEAIYQE